MVFVALFKLLVQFVSLSVFSLWCFTNSNGHSHEKLSLLIGLIVANWFSSAVLFIVTVLQYTEIPSLAEQDYMVFNSFWFSRERKCYFLLPIKHLINKIKSFNSRT